MKKTLVALALACSSGVLSAADFTVYGVADVGLRFTHQSETGKKDADQLQMMSGQNAGSRFGFKGTETLGNGWSVGFQLENQYDVDTGELRKGLLFHRQSTVHVSSPYGTLMFGRVGTLSSAAGTYDVVFGIGDPVDGGDGAVSGVLSYESRRDNTVIYATPQLAGFRGYLEYSFGQKIEDARENQNERYIGLGVRYSNGPLDSALTYEHVRYADNPSTDETQNYDDKTVVSFAGSYDMQVTKLQMIAQWMEGADNLGNDWTGKGFDGWAVQLGNTTPLAGGLFYVMAGYADGDYASTLVGQGKQFDLSAWSLGIRYWYPFSKKTALYTGIGYQELQREYTATKPDFESKVYQMYLGLTHKF